MEDVIVYFNRGYFPIRLEILLLAKCTSSGYTIILCSSLSMNETVVVALNRLHAFIKYFSRAHSL